MCSVNKFSQCAFLSLTIVCFNCYKVPLLFVAFCIHNLQQVIQKCEYFENVKTETFHWTSWTIILPELTDFIEPCISFCNEVKYAEKNCCVRLSWSCVMLLALLGVCVCVCEETVTVCWARIDVIYCQCMLWISTMDNYAFACSITAWCYASVVLAVIVCLSICPSIRQTLLLYQTG